MGYFKNTTVWGGGHYGPPSNFVVLSSIMIKFGVKVTKINKTNLQNDVTAEL